MKHIYRYTEERPICALKHEEVKNSFVIKLEAGRRNERKLRVFIRNGLIKISLDMEEAGRMCGKVQQSSRRHCWGVLGFVPEVSLHITG